MIEMKELYQELLPPSDEVAANLVILHWKLNVLRACFGEPLFITSGFRTMERQLAIYQNLGRPAPLGSQHLIGAAADISDPQQKLQRWILDHLEWMEMQSVWLEEFEATKNWVHLQVIPYGSFQPGKSIFFKP